MNRKTMTKLTALLLALVLLAACGTSNPGNEAGVDAVGTVAADHSATAAESDISVEIANPWTDHATLAEAETAVGFSFHIPDDVCNMEPSAFRTAEGILEVQYETPEGAEMPMRFTFRKGADETDISGDYNTYSVVETFSHPVSSTDSVEYTMYGNEGMLCAARWIQDGHFYSVYGEGFEQFFIREYGEDSEELSPAFAMIAIAGTLIALNNPVAAEEP